MRAAAWRPPQVRRKRRSDAPYEDTATGSCRGREASLEWYNWGMEEHTPKDELRVVPVKDTDPAIAMLLRVLESTDRHEPVIE